MPALLVEIPWSPNITKLGPFLLTWHGLFTAVGILAGVWLALRMAAVVRWDPDEAYSTALVAVPCGIIGARALFVAEAWGYYGQHPWEIIQLTEGGISIWGAILGGVFGGALFALARRYPIGRGLDVGAFGMLLGQAVGRIGDLINGEHLASATKLPWGVIYTNPDSPAFAHSLTVGPHHPATTYELLGDLIILGAMFGLLLRVRYVRAHPGLTFCFYFAAYAAMRFLITYTRVDSSYVLGLRVPQLVSLIAIVLVVPLAAYFAFGYHDRALDPPATSPLPPGRIPVARRVPPPPGRRGR